MHAGAVVILTILAATWISIQVVVWTRLKQSDSSSLLIWRMRIKGIGVSLIVVGLIPLFGMSSITAHVVGRTLVVLGIVLYVVAMILTYVYLLTKRFRQGRG